MAEILDASTDASSPVETIPQAITDKFEEVFNREDAAPEPQSESTPAPRPSNFRQEQKDELNQEGLEGEQPETPAESITPEGEEEAEAQDQATETASPLDPNLRFAAQQFGWKDTEIDKLYGQNPEVATRTFENLLSAFHNLSRQTGMLPPAAQQPQALPPAAQPQAQQSKFLQHVANLKEFSEANGESMGEVLKALHDEVYQPLKQIQAEYAVAKQQAVAAEASTTTDALAAKFSDFYGQGEKLTLVNQQNRQMLYQIADQLRSGAYQQGKEISVKDAINRAHLIVTADRRVAEGRKQVAEQVQKRSRQITARPTQRVNPKSAGVSKGEQAAADAYSRRAAELGIDTGEMVD